MESMIKPLYSIEELLDMQRLEKEIWGDDFTPIQQTVTVAKNGGIILGSYVEDRLIGFLYSFPGFKDGNVYLCSHMMGIAPDYRGQGIGESLKHKQREMASASGMNVITWTFDPLESANANLNIRKLRGICRTYMENYYGKLKGQLNKGLPTDRFLVEWHIDSEHVREQMSYSNREAVSVLSVKQDEGGYPCIEGVNSEVISDLTNYTTLKVAVPTQFQAMKKEAFSLAKQWREKIREVFQLLFANGYVIVDVKRDTEETIQYYILIKQSEIKIELAK
ncbi:MAG: GNAT family N-acetyltransferase [Bacillus sp. (in: firmicutes)]